MSDGTRAVPLELIEDGVNKRRALCPACPTGFLHPYRVSVDLGGMEGQQVGIAWVAICKGAKAGERYRVEAAEPCGFTLPLTAYRHIRFLGLVAQHTAEGR